MKHCPLMEDFVKNLSLWFVVCKDKQDPVEKKLVRSLLELFEKPPRKQCKDPLRLNS